MKTVCLIQGTVCNDLSESCTSGTKHWGKDHLEKLPESLVVDPRKNEIWGSWGIVWENIDITEAKDIANNFETYRVNNSDDKVITEAAIGNQECEEPAMTELEIWFDSQDFRTEFDKVEDTIYNDDILIEIVLNIKILPQGKGLKSLFDSDQESDNECTELKETIVSHHNNDDKKELDSKVTLIIRAGWKNGFVSKQSLWYGLFGTSQK